MDDADHTLSQCPEWDEERQILIGEMGTNLTIPRLVKKILESREAWHNFANFCGNVMRRKEEAERVRQGQQQLSGTEELNAALATDRDSRDDQQKRSRRGGPRAERRGQAADPPVAAGNWPNTAASSSQTDSSPDD